MQLIIPVAGKGTRLRPHTITTAKPLVHVAGKTVLDHILNRFKNLPITELILITGHLGDQFKDFKAPWPVRLVEQEVMRGTADAINLTRPYIKGPVIIEFSDTIFDADLSIIAKSDADGILWAKEVEDYQNFGVIVHNNSVMTQIIEKPSEPISKLANIGLYYIKDYKALFDGIDYVLKHKPGKGGEFFLTDAFQHMVDAGKKLQVAQVEGWYDTGTWGATIETNRVLLKQHDRSKEFAGCTIVPPVWIEDGVSIEHSVIGPYVSIAKGAIIEHSLIADSIINKDAVVKHIDLHGSIVGDAATVIGKPKKLNVGSHSTTEL